MLHQLREAYRKDFIRDWRTAGNEPDWFNHWYGIMCPDIASPLPTWERALFSSRYVTPEMDVVDLCCGDGFFDYFVFSPMASSVLAVDKNGRALDRAREFHSAPNIEYVLADVLTYEFSPRSLSVIHGAIEHFTEDEQRALFRKCSTCAVFIGSTVLPKDKKLHADHKHEFESRDDLLAMLWDFYDNVWVSPESVWNGTRYIYWAASQANGA